MEPQTHRGDCLKLHHPRLVPSASPGGHAVRLAAGRPYPLPWPGGPGSPKVASGANPLPLRHVPASWQLCSPATRPPPGGGWPENFQVTNRQEQFHNRTLCVCAYRTQVRVGKATTALGTADAGGGYWYPLPTLTHGYAERSGTANRIRAKETPVPKGLRAPAT